MRRSFAAAFLALGFLGSIGQAGAGCRVDADDPMVSAESFGLSACLERGPRYHTHDYDGEAARGYVQIASSDPMVWADDQWRSSLFGYNETSSSGYDQRVRRAPAQIVEHVEKRLVIRSIEDQSDGEEVARPRGPKHINVRTLGEMKTSTGVQRFGGHDCRGVLVLTWGSLGSRSRCYDRRSRIRTMPEHGG